MNHSRRPTKSSNFTYPFPLNGLISTLMRHLKPRFFSSQKCTFCAARSGEPEYLWCWHSISTVRWKVLVSTCSNFGVSFITICWFNKRELKHVSIVFGRTLFSNNVRATIAAEIKNGDYFWRLCFDLSWRLNNNNAVKTSQPSLRLHKI